MGRGVTTTKGQNMAAKKKKAKKKVTRKTTKKQTIQVASVKKVAKSNGASTTKTWDIAEPVLGKVAGPPTMPLDQIVGMMKELEDAHRVLDALDLPPGTISERLVESARKWLKKLGGNTSTHPGRWAQKVIQAAGGSMWIKPEEMELDG